jgi:hypothetical protein
MDSSYQSSPAVNKAPLLSLRVRYASAAVCISGLLGGCIGSFADAGDAQQLVANLFGDSQSQRPSNELTDDLIAQSMCTSAPGDPGLLEPAASRRSALAGLKAMSGDHVAMLASTVNWNVVAIASGTWSDPRTWQGGRVPADGDNVRIPQGLIVNVVFRESAALARIYVEGQLNFAPAQDTRLIVDTMLVGANATVQMGTPAQPLLAGVSAELVIQSRAAEAPLNVAERTRGIIASGRFVTNGPDKDNMVALTGDALKNSTSLQFQKAPTGWAVGDEIVVTGTRFHWANSQGETLLENEVRRITAINGATVTLDGKLVYDHIRALGEGSAPY